MNSGHFISNPAFLDQGYRLTNTVQFSAHVLRNIAASPSGDIYLINSSDIWMRPAVGGSFASTGAPSRSWAGLCAAPNGDIYASETNGSVWIRAGGVGSFVDLVQTNRRWHALAAAPNGDIYCTILAGGDIYRRAAGVGNFIGLGEPSRDCRGAAAAPNGDIYVGVSGGDIFKRTGGVGSFAATGQTSRAWNCMTADVNGHIYAGDGSNGLLYRLAPGASKFIPLCFRKQNWSGITQAADKAMWFCSSPGFVFYHRYLI